MPRLQTRLEKIKEDLTKLMIVEHVTCYLNTHGENPHIGLEIKIGGSAGELGEYIKQGFENTDLRLESRIEDQPGCQILHIQIFPTSADPDERKKAFPRALNYLHDIAEQYIQTHKTR